MCVLGDIHCRLFGDDMQFIEVNLEPGESIIGSPRALMYVDEGICLERFNNNKRLNVGIVNKLTKKANKKEIVTFIYTNKDNVVRSVTFSASYPGKIIHIELDLYRKKIVCNKDAFLCATKDTLIKNVYMKRIESGYNNKNFILQTLEGNGQVFLHAGGAIVKRELNKGEVIRVNIGCIVALTSGLEYDIQFIKGYENLYYLVIKGPGLVWLQSMSLNIVADNNIEDASIHEKEG